MPCPACGYNLRGATQESCPECGTTLAISVVRAGTEPFIKALRLLFLSLIVWSGAGQLPGAIMEMFSAWQMAGTGRASATSWFVWYVISECVIALGVLVLAIFGLRATYKVSQPQISRQYALMILILQCLATVYHIVLSIAL